MSVIIECRDFSFSYGAKRVLENINFSLERGEFLSIMGPNGSGKSTLLKNMLRLVDGRSTGEMLVADRPIGEYGQKELARILAYVPQAGGRVPPFTVREFLQLSRYPFGPHNVRVRACASVERALEATRTADIADRRLDQLSGGQRQRAYLAAALAQDAEVLLLDEPTSFLDPKYAQLMNELLKSLHAQGHLTLISVTHDLSQPFDTGGKALVLAMGRQIHFGPTGDLADKGILDKAFCHDFNYLTHPKTGRTLVVA